MKRQLFITLLTGLGMVGAHGQDINKKLKEIWGNVQIRKAFVSLDDLNAPATFSFTLPKDGSNSFLVNGGIAYNWVVTQHDDSTNRKISLVPFFVLNRNTQIAKEQNNYTLGIANGISIGHLSKTSNQYFLLNNTLQYQRDRMDTSHSLFITSYFSEVRSSGSGIRFNTFKLIRNGLLYFLGWSVGPEFQYKFTSADSSLKGGVGRIFYNVEAHLLQKSYKKGEPPGLGDPLVELVVTNTGRYDLLNSSYHKEGYLPLFKAELLVYPARSYDFSIGFSYNTGSDPIAGLAKQEYYLLAVKIKH
jgi:hypothetical protein